jgi:hypothetical protein
MPNYIPAIPLISNHNTCFAHDVRWENTNYYLSLDTHKYKTTFTLTTKIVLKFSSCFIFSSSSDEDCAINPSAVPEKFTSHFLNVLLLFINGRSRFVVFSELLLLFGSICFSTCGYGECWRFLGATLSNCRSDLSR